MDRSEIRASNADREQAAQRLRGALDEGRLSLHEYDERLRSVYEAKTYGEIDALLKDLPQPPPPGAPAAWTPGPDGRYPAATRRWIAHRWAGWAGPVMICVVIWAASSLFSGDLVYFWPFWVAVPWGIFLLVQTIRGIADGEPQRFAARQERRAARRELRRARHP